MDSTSESERVMERMGGVDKIVVFTKDLTTKPNNKLYDYCQFFHHTDILTDINGVKITKDELNIKLNNMETMTIYVNGGKVTYCPANQNAPMPSLVNLFGIDMDDSVEYKIEPLGHNCSKAQL